MYRSSPFRRTLNTGYITALDMCEVCTEAVHSVELWTRVTSQLWTSTKYEPPSDTFVHISTTLTRFYVPRTILRLHFRGASFENSTTLPRLYLWHLENSMTLTRAPNQPGAKNNSFQYSIFDYSKSPSGTGASIFEIRNKKTWEDQDVRLDT